MTIKSTLALGATLACALSTMTVTAAHAEGDMEKCFGVAEAAWTVVVLLLGAGIGTLRMRMDRDPFYGAALVWAYGGIWLKHASRGGFHGQYPIVIMTTIACIVLFLGAIGSMAFRKSAAKET